MRRYNHQFKKQKAKSKIIKLIISLVLFFALIFLVFIIVKVLTLGKFIYINNKDGDVELIVIDPNLTKPVKMKISKDFIVDSSRNFGEYKLGNLWRLGEKEKYQGKLVVETIAKNFRIPIYLYMDRNISNLNIYQKIKVYLSNLDDSQYDYEINSKILTDSIEAKFINTRIAEGYLKLGIDDMTGDRGSANMVSKILEILGYKTTSYTKGFDEYLDCEVVGKDKFNIEIPIKIFSCQGSIDPNLAVDLKIRIGKVFATRF